MAEGSNKTIQEIQELERQLIAIVDNPVEVDAEVLKKALKYNTLSQYRLDSTPMELENLRVKFNRFSNMLKDPKNEILIKVSVQGVIFELDKLPEKIKQLNIYKKSGITTAIVDVS